MFRLFLLKLQILAHMVGRDFVSHPDRSNHSHTESPNGVKSVAVPHFIKKAREITTGRQALWAVCEPPPSLFSVPGWVAKYSCH